jgi:hypothetical protein
MQEPIAFESGHHPLEGRLGEDPPPGGERQGVASRLGERT